MVVANSSVLSNGQNRNMGESNGVYQDSFEQQYQLTQYSNSSANKLESLQIRGMIGTGDDMIITAPAELNSIGDVSQNGLEFDLDENMDEETHQDVYGYAERAVANKPARFLLSLEHRAVETYGDFNRNFALQFVRYDQNYPRQDQKLPESCLRAGDLAKIYCDRVCDYPFSAIKHVAFSPNPDSFPYLVSVSHIGLCRIDKIETVDQVYRGHVEVLGSALLQKAQSSCND